MKRKTESERVSQEVPYLEQPSQECGMEAISIYYTTSRSGGGTYEDPTLPAQNGAQDETLSSQKREENSPLIVEITKENEHRVSRYHKGMLKNPDGTFTRTPQYETWNTNNEIQLRDNHESTPVMPEEVSLTPYHPKPTRMKLVGAGIQR